MCGGVGCARGTDTELGSGRRWEDTGPHARAGLSSRPRAPVRSPPCPPVRDPPSSAPPRAPPSPSPSPYGSAIYNASARASSPSKLPWLDAFTVKETKQPSKVAANTGYVPSISRLMVFAKPGRPRQGLRGMMGEQKVAELLTCL